jgi:hypothetical protein
VQRAVLFAALALLTGLLVAAADARAQNPLPRDAPPEGLDVPPRAASPAGARYIPGVGFRLVPPPGTRVYGYYAAPRVYGYYADRESMRYRRYYRPASCSSHRLWRGERCGRRWY